MYSIFDGVQQMLLDFINNNLVMLVIMVIAFNVMGFCFFNKK